MKRTDIAALAKAIIARSFPGLQGRAIKVKLVKTGDYVMAVRPGKAIRLWVSKADAKRMGRRALIGVLAHELCHAEEDLQQDPIRDALLSMACDFIPGLETGLETVSERRVDAAVIRKGYGQQLLAFQKYHDRHYEPYEPTDGMTVEEIEAALRAASGAGKRVVDCR